MYRRSALKNGADDALTKSKMLNHENDMMNNGASEALSKHTCGFLSLAFKKVKGQS